MGGAKVRKACAAALGGLFILDCTGASPTTATLTATDADANTSEKAITVTETALP